MLRTKSPTDSEIQAVAGFFFEHELVNPDPTWWDGYGDQGQHRTMATDTSGDRLTDIIRLGPGGEGRPNPGPETVAIRETLAKRPKQFHLFYCLETFVQGHVKKNFTPATGVPPVGQA